MSDRPGVVLRVAGLLVAIIVWQAVVDPPAVQGQDRAAREYEIKAAFLYNFTKFVEWPNDTGSSRRICVLAADPFGEALETIVGRTTHGKTVEVRRVARAEDGKSCHLLFISSAAERDLAQILSELDGSHVLTVGEMGRFAERGGMIELATSKNRIRLRINLAAAERAALNVSSHLVRLAAVVRSSVGRTQ